MDKSAIKNFAMQARNILRTMAEKEAGFYGVTKDECAAPIHKGADFETYKTPAGIENTIYGADIRRRASLQKAVDELGFEQVIEETAYTWFNRIIAIRFMEVNDYLPTRVRVLSSENGGLTPDIVSHSLDVELNLTPEELEKVQRAKDANRFDEAYRILFIKQCNELNDILPGLFERTDDYMELLLKVSYTGDSVIRLLVDTVAEDNFNVEAEGQVEIIGWMYQYYNSELKDDTFAKLKKNIKITKERIPAATQLFTPDWIVRYMVENSVGRVWIDHLRAVNESLDEKTTAEEFGWKYYLPEAEQEDEVAKQLVEVRKSYKDIMPQDISCIDPCMGSGHILVYMFDVLMDIYKSEGYSERDSVFDILEKNIFGLDIDRRAYQLSYFALMMKGRDYGGRRFFRGKEDENEECIPVMPHVYAIEESNSIRREQVQYFGVGLDELSKKTAITQLNGLLDTMKDAKEYGSILNVENYNWKLLRSFVTESNTEGQMTFDSISVENSKRLITQLVDIGEVLARKYDAVVTNPPYMGLSNGNAKLNTFIKEKYPNGKADLCTCFMEKCITMSMCAGYMAMINIPAWMSLVSFQNLRKKIVKNNTITSLIQFGRGVFGSDFGSVSFVIGKKHLNSYKGVYLKLFTKSGSVDSVEEKEKMFFLNQSYYSSQNNFELIPGCPIAYWLSKNFVDTFRYPTIGAKLTTREGMATADNERFLRLWFEVPYREIDFMAKLESGKCNSSKKWFPYNKGGDYRKWYGNLYYVVNWNDDGFEIRNNKDQKTGRIRSHNYNGEYAFRDGLTWTSLSISTISVRRAERGALFDSKGAMGFADSYESVLRYLALLNSIVGTEYLKIFSPTVDFKVGDVIQLPDIAGCEKDIINYTQKNIEISKADWDSFETSWDFEGHPLISKNRMIFDDIDLAECYKCWKSECDDRFNQLKENEEELNRIFIDIYGLQNELIPKIEDKDVTVRKADVGRDIRSLISFAVGCMFGRYSIEEKGLIYAGGEFDSSKYGRFSADDDAIIPITDEAYFDDDIVCRFEEFIRIVYGAKSLERNLNYIAEALGIKGTTAREKIRNYFLKDFFKDHCNTYSVTGSGKRPIYWLFDSGKQNGFKALIYMHRYTPDTVGLVRSVYLKKASDAIEASLKNAEYIISENASAVDVAQATKKRDKYVKQLAEIKPYYQALSHVAMQRIPIDLDDGVKVNYAKFQGIEIAEDGGKYQTINLLAKI